jgi:hypothetical protein
MFRTRFMERRMITRDTVKTNYEFNPRTKTVRSYATLLIERYGEGDVREQLVDDIMKEIYGDPVPVPEVNEPEPPAPEPIVTPVPEPIVEVAEVFEPVVTLSEPEPIVEPVAVAVIEVPVVEPVPEPAKVEVVEVVEATPPRARRRVAVAEPATEAIEPVPTVEVLE